MDSLTKTKFYNFYLSRVHLYSDIRVNSYRIDIAETRKIVKIKIFFYEHHRHLFKSACSNDTTSVLLYFKTQQHISAVMQQNKTKSNQSELTFSLIIFTKLMLNA